MVAGRRRWVKRMKAEGSQAPQWEEAGCEVIDGKLRHACGGVREKLAAGMTRTMSASLIGRLGSSTFRLSSTAVSMSLRGLEPLFSPWEGPTRAGRAFSARPAVRGSLA